MNTPTSAAVRSAFRWGRSHTKRLLGRRRPQLLFAVLFGAVIGGGFTAVVSVGMGDHGHDEGPGLSVSGQPVSGQPDGLGDHSGYDSVEG